MEKTLRIDEQRELTGEERLELLLAVASFLESQVGTLPPDRHRAAKLDIADAWAEAARQKRRLRANRRRASSIGADFFSDGMWKYYAFLILAFWIFFNS